MKIKMIRNTVASGREVFEGKTYRVPEDISEADARRLLAMGKAREVANRRRGENGQQQSENQSQSSVPGEGQSEEQA